MARKKKPRADNLDETQGGGGFLENYRGKRNYQVSLSERIRELVDLDLIAKYWFTILEGYNAVWIKNKKGEYYDVIPDPNPLTGSSTPAQRDAAVRELMNRGWGLAVQQLQLDATFNKHQETLPLSGVDLDLLAKLNELLAPKQLTNIVDAELVQEPVAEQLQEPDYKNGSSELQEPCQVELANDLVNKDVLQELGQVFAQIAELIVSTNENSPLGDDPSEL